MKPMMRLAPLLFLAPLLALGAMAVASVMLSSRISRRREVSPYWIQKEGDGERLLHRLREGGL
jgi:hypothetical protein